jgi:3-carboxy-cis,cis-muconate cycloisomerase
VEHLPAGQDRNGVLRLLSLELIFSDEHCAEALSDQSYLAAMARFEGALALASAKAGVIPAHHAQTIAKVCAAASLDSKKLARAARHAGTPVIPLVKELTDQVATVSPDAARHVHFGGTSQDAMDTAAALCLKVACARLAELTAQLGDATAALARRYERAPIAARTLLQPAAPVAFGWKAAVWLSLLARTYPRFQAAAAEACVLQFGGASGTLAAFGDKGDAVAAALAQELELGRSSITWHSARDAFARLGAEMAILAGASGKIARDVALLMQPEIGEVAEPAAPGRGGSSALPHKRNPSGCVWALEAAQRSPGLAATLIGHLSPEHERGLGQWQSQFLTLRELACSASSALAAMVEVVRGLKVDEAAMRRNLDRTAGLVFSEAVSLRLADKLGKAKAHALTEALCEAAIREGVNLEEAIRRNAEAAQAIPANELKPLFQAENCFGSGQKMIERVLADWASARGTSP